MDQGATDFLTRHSESAHAYVSAVCGAASRGQCEADAPSGSVDCEEVLKIYRIRAEHLARFATPHAARLRQDVVRFCERLESCKGQRFRWWTFQCPDGVTYAFAEHATSHELLGAIRTVSKLRVSPEEWERLWGAVV